MSGSLAKHSLGRLSADVAGVVLGIFGGIITARWLGPDGKGQFSTITYLVGMFVVTTQMGLGEAVVVLVGKKQVSTQAALSGTMAVALVLSAAGVIGLWVAGRLTFPETWSSTQFLILLACAGLPVSVVSSLGSYVLNAERRLDVTNRVLLINHILVALSLWVFIVALHLGVTGGLLATIVGATASSMIIVVALRETKLSVRPRYDAAYIRQAFRYGPKFMLSTLLMGVSARADLLVVHELLGDRETGFYSIALTLSAMAGMIPGALTNASFPHLANFEEREWIDTTIRVCRLGLATAILTSIGMVIAIPVVLPLLFGARYLPAIVPANILIVGAIFASAQWLICRSAAARGRMRPLFVSYAANFAVMLGLDVLLIPIYGNIGAAWASVIAPVLGLAVAIVEFNRGQTTKLSFNLVPRPADVVEVWKIVTRTVLRHSARDTRE